MALYTYRCSHGHTTEKILPVAEHATRQDCDVCGLAATRLRDWRISHRMRKRGVLHTPGYRPARIDPETFARKDQHG